MLCCIALPASLKNMSTTWCIDEVEHVTTSSLSRGAKGMMLVCVLLYFVSLKFITPLIIYCMLRCAVGS